MPARCILVEAAAAMQASWDPKLSDVGFCHICSVARRECALHKETEQGGGGNDPDLSTQGSTGDAGQGKHSKPGVGSQGSVAGKGSGPGKA